MQLKKKPGGHQRRSLEPKASYSKPDLSCHWHCLQRLIPDMYQRNFKATLSNLVLLSGFCMACQMLRMCGTLSTTFLYLSWNLLLAWIPMFFALKFHQSNGSYLTKLYFLCWLIFFPNAPYIITDLLHLKPRNDFPFWFDSILFYSYALTGVMLGITSALIVFRRAQNVMSRITSNILIGAVMILSGYGIYIGRYLRFNSWNVLDCPFEILSDAFERLSHPADHMRTYGLMVMTGTLLYLMFRVCESLTLPDA